MPEKIKKLAKKNYKLWKSNPNHPSLELKKIESKSTIYSIRVGTGYRVLGVKEEDIIIWFWIGSHSDYDKIIN